MTRNEAIARGLNTARGVCYGTMLCVSFWLAVYIVIRGIS